MNNVEAYRKMLKNIKNGKCGIELHNNDTCPCCGDVYGGKNCLCESLDDYVIFTKRTLTYYADITKLFEPFASDVWSTDDMKTIVTDLVNMWYLKNRNLFDLVDCMKICMYTYKYIPIFKKVIIPYELFVDAINNKFADMYVLDLLNKLGVNENDIS